MNKQEAIQQLKAMTPILMRSSDCTLDMAKAQEMAISALEKQIPKLAEYTELFGKFKCPSCGEMYDAVYDDKTGEPSVWFNHCPECGQYVVTKE